MAKSSTRLVLICGLPASGKSTLARQLAPKVPAIRLDKDGWVTHRGQSVILEWGHWARAERDEKRLGARALGVGVELHCLDAPLDEILLFDKPVADS